MHHLREGCFQLSGPSSHITHGSSFRTCSALPLYSSLPQPVAHICGLQLVPSVIIIRRLPSAGVWSVQVWTDMWAWLCTESCAHGGILPSVFPENNGFLDAACAWRLSSLVSYPDWSTACAAATSNNHNTHTTILIPFTHCASNCWLIKLKKLIKSV